MAKTSRRSSGTSTISPLLEKQRLSSSGSEITLNSSTSSTEEKRQKHKAEESSVSDRVEPSISHSASLKFLAKTLFSLKAVYKWSSQLKLLHTVPGASNDLYHALAQGMPCAVEYCLQRGHPPDADGGKPLQLAIKLGHVGAVQALLEGGASLETKNDEGQMPLEQAFALLSPDAKNHLISRRIPRPLRSVTGRRQRKRVAQRKARDKSSLQILEVIVAPTLLEQVPWSTANSTGLCEFAERGSTIHVWYLLWKGCSPNSHCEGLSACDYAYINQHREAEHYLRVAGGVTTISLISSAHSQHDKRLRDRWTQNLSSSVELTENLLGRENHRASRPQIGRVRTRVLHLVQYFGTAAFLMALKKECNLTAEAL